jgi:hypothetical protein
VVFYIEGLLAPSTVPEEASRPEYVATSCSDCLLRVYANPEWDARGELSTLSRHVPALDGRGLLLLGAAPTPVTAHPGAGRRRQIQGWRR